jgi:HEAT repeat protein
MKLRKAAGILFLSIGVAWACLTGGCKEGEMLKLGDDDKVFKPRDYEQQAYRVITESLNDEVAVIRSNAIEVISETGSRNYMPFLRKMLSDESVAVRFAAAVAIGDMKYSSAAYEVKQLMRDRDANARIAAAYAIAKLGNKRTSELIEAALNSEDQTLRANAAMLLGKLGDKSKVAKLYKTLYDDNSSDRVKINAMEAIARLGEEQIYNRLWSLLISKHPDDKVMGIRAMGQLNTEESRDAIITMISDEMWEVRLTAAEELARLGNPTGEPEVIEYFEEACGSADERTVANFIATMSIGYIGSEELNNYLPERLESESKSVRLAAAQSVLLQSKKR